MKPFASIAPHDLVKMLRNSSKNVLNRHKSKGFTLLPVVLAMSLIAAIAFLLNRDNGINISMVAKQMDTDRARYAAEAGLQAANAKVQSVNCSGYPVSASPIANNNFSGASYSAYATSASGNTTGLVSTGTYNGASVTLTRNNIYVYQASPNTYTLQPNAAAGIDTYITKPSTQNRGTNNTLNADTGNNFPLIKFDLSMFPAGSLPISATLSLYGSGGLGIGTINVFRLTNDWQEDTVNWPTRIGTNTWNVPGGDYFSEKVTSAGAVTGAWVNLDITDLATSWLTNRHPNYGVIMNMASGIGSINFTSSDNSDAARWPKLTFNYLVPCGTTGPEDPPPITTVTLNPIADSFNDSGAPLANNGATTSLKTYYTPARENRILMQFNTSSIPSGASIQSAVLRTYVSAVGSATTNTKAIWANAINESWAEGTGNNTNKTCPTATVGASWNYRTGCTNWSFISPPYTAQAWATMAPMPTARSGHMVASVNGKIYAIGGWIYSGDVLNTVEEYNPATNTWTTRATMPTARARAGIAVVNGIIYVMGGHPKNGSTLSVNEAYNPATNTWTTKAAMPTNRTNLAAAAANNKIYALGGLKTSTCLRNNEEYDPTTNTWATKTQMPTARCYFSAQSVNGKIYAIGGFASLSLNTNEEYNPSGNSWATKANIPIETDSMASTVLGNKIYLIAGMRGSILTNRVWMYDVLHNTYTAQQNYPISDNEPAAATINGYIYSVGGDDFSSTVYKNHYQYDPGIPTPIATASNESTSASPLAANFTSGWINFDLKPLVQEWVDGVRPNNGLVLYTEVADQFSINSRENSSNKPQLIVTYQ